MRLRICGLGFGPTLDAHVFESHVKTVIIYKLGFNENYSTFTSILLIKIVL